MWSSGVWMCAGLPEDERLKCMSQSASFKMRQKAITGSVMSVASKRNLAGILMSSPSAVVADRVV